MCDLLHNKLTLTLSTVWTSLLPMMLMWLGIVTSGRLINLTAIATYFYNSGTIILHMVLETVICGGCGCPSRGHSLLVLPLVVLQIAQGIL